MSISDLCDLASEPTKPTAFVLPEPSLPPVVAGGPTVPLSQALAQAKAAEDKAAARERTSNGYPFATKREIVARLADDREFRREAMLVLFCRQTDDEVAERDTKWRNRKGLMSSHAVHGTRIAEAILRGEALSYEDDDRLAGIVVRYGKQLADHYRRQALRDNPALAAQAARFGISAL